MNWKTLQAAVQRIDFTRAVLMLLFFNGALAMLLKDYPAACAWFLMQIALKDRS